MDPTRRQNARRRLMNETHVCHRCKLPVVGTRYSFRVDADPPLPLANPVEILICTSCLESMQRWMERRRRSRESSSQDSDDVREPEPSSSVGGKSRKKHKKRKSHYDNSLRDAERWLRIRTGVTISAMVTVFVVLFLFIAMEIAGFRYGRPGHGNDAVTSPPPLPTVDPSHPK